MIIWVVTRHGYDESIVMGAFTSRSLAALAVMREIHEEQMSDIMDGGRGNIITNYQNYGNCYIEIITNESDFDEFTCVMYSIAQVVINNF